MMEQEKVDALHISSTFDATPRQYPVLSRAKILEDYYHRPRKF